MTEFAAEFARCEELQTLDPRFQFGKEGGIV